MEVDIPALVSFYEMDSSTVPEVDVFVHNVVSQFETGCALDLYHIARTGINVEYSHKHSPVLQMKIKNPYCTARMHSSGKIFCTGATSVEDAKQAARRFVRRLRKLGYVSSLRHFKVVNIFASCSLPFAVNIPQFVQNYPVGQYEPELHSGMTVQLRTPRATLKIFSTGSVTVMSRSVEELLAAVQDVYLKTYSCSEKRDDTTQRQPRSPRRRRLKC